MSDVNDDGARIRTSYVASENRERQLSDLGSLETSQSLTSNVAGPSAIGLHGASKVLGGCSTSLDQLLHPPSYTSTTLVFSVVCFSYSTIQLVLAVDCFSTVDSRLPTVFSLITI